MGWAQVLAGNPEQVSGGGERGGQTKGAHYLLAPWCHNSQEWSLPWCPSVGVWTRETWLTYTMGH